MTVAVLVSPWGEVMFVPIGGLIEALVVERAAAQGWAVKALR